MLHMDFSVDARNASIVGKVACISTSKTSPKAKYLRLK